MNESTLEIPKHSRDSKYISASHVPRTNESCPTYKCVMSYKWMSQLSRFHIYISRLHIYISESCHAPFKPRETGTSGAMTWRTYCQNNEWVMSHIEMSHVSRFHIYIRESCLTYEWVMFHLWMSHVPHRNESRLEIPHIYLYISESWHAPFKPWYTGTCSGTTSNILSNCTNPYDRNRDRLCLLPA